MRKIIIISLFAAISINIARGQGSWKRSEEQAPVELQLFRANQTINLPTAETLEKGNFEFEISHRFSHKISEGVDYLYGLDGPVNMRLGLSYGVTSRLIIALARSNLDDNIDFRFRYKFAQIRNKDLPLLIAVQGGTAWSTQVYADGQRRKKGDSRNFQFYGQLIINTLIQKKVGIGLVPSFVTNSDIYDPKTKNTLSFGGYFQYYFNRVFAVMAECSPVIDGFKRDYTAASFGIEINTGGHFFKIIATNSIYLNPSQYLSGTEYQFKPKEWRLGFNITRLLQFGK